MGGCDLHRSYGMVVILLSFLSNYDNLVLNEETHQKKRSYADEGWLFILLPSWKCTRNERCY